MSGKNWVYWLSVVHTQAGCKPYQSVGATIRPILFYYYNIIYYMIVSCLKLLGNHQILFELLY